MDNFRKDLETLINRTSLENGSDTPDFILAEYLIDCLKSYDRAVVARDGWLGRPVGDGAAILQAPREVLEAQGAAGCQ